MAEDLKFIPSDASFDPETVNLLSDAFEHAWHKVQTSGNRLARPGCANMMREVMAKHIFNLAEHGERDESKLSNSAFHFLPRTTRLTPPQLAAARTPGSERRKPPRRCPAIVTARRC
jgi:hypothetical protein